MGMKRQQQPLSLAVAVLGVIPLLALFRADAPDDKGQEKQRNVSYARDVVPIIQKFCITCHTAEEEHPSELYVDSYESLMKGGRHGKGVVPGNAGESLMYQKMLPNPPFGRMMPPSKRLRPSEGQVETIRLWIDQGAEEN